MDICSIQSKSDTFQKVLNAFDAAKAECYATWPTVFADFEKAFKNARKDRAVYTPRLNILDVFGLKTWELTHSRVIKWFLDEKETHEQGSLFMDCLLKECGVYLSSCVGYTVQREKPQRVDIVAYKPGTFAVFIENKVNHHEREDQLADLQTELVRFSVANQIPESHRIAIFLTDDGREPTSAYDKPLAGFLDGNLYSIRRFTLFQAFRDALALSADKSELLTIFLKSYIDAISSHPGANL